MSSELKRLVLGGSAASPVPRCTGGNQNGVAIIMYNNIMFTKSIRLFYFDYFDYYVRVIFLNLACC